MTIGDVNKIPTVFLRDPENRKRTLSEVNPGCEWVLASEGKPTRKYDGTCVMLDPDGVRWARRGATRPGTYELIGPKINGNPENVPTHRLVAHADAEVFDTPRDFEGLRTWLLAHPQYEGIVWHHPDGRRAKLKHRDFAA